MTDSQSAAGYPLAHLKVLDFSRVLAGPFAGRLLCDLGADVVKVEPPDGDVTRLWGRVVAHLPGFYHQQNAGKRDICIDLRTDGGRQLAIELAAKADILIENFRPDVMPRLGLGYEALRAVNPRLVMLSISGFGQGGPESHRPAYAPIIHAEAGLLARQARRGRIPYRDLPLSVADTNASLHGLVGLLAAIIARQQTGVGQHIDLAMIDATVATDDQLHYDLEDSEATAPLTSETWESGAGWILVSADFRYLWRILVNEFDLIDPTHKTMPLAEKIRLRRECMQAFFAGLESWEAVEAAMARVNIAWGRVREGADLAEQPTLAARGLIRSMDDRAGGQRPVVQAPWRFSNAKHGVRGPAPHRGEHNAAVLADWLGRSATEAEALTAAGILLHDEAALGEQS
ncbi:MAG: CoA transferase [Gammaproteobacteria bacterium]|nr:CoA transferase [Gammaproteobacteria bacterium]MYE53498.1 CoA transferase [Gammaproteobacteria bacterium]MYF48925.1 CoA transferase [Gammaproteobacteria bacterium]